MKGHVWGGYHNHGTYFGILLLSSYMDQVNSIPDIFLLTIFLVLQKVVFYTLLITRYKYCTCSFVYLFLDFNKLYIH